ncbi:unnamed protein product, partial [Ectocarpus sp. 6 AP-2014]
CCCCCFVSLPGGVGNVILTFPYSYVRAAAQHHHHHHHHHHRAFCREFFVRCVTFRGFLVSYAGGGGKRSFVRVCLSFCPSHRKRFTSHAKKDIFRVGVRPGAVCHVRHRSNRVFSAQAAVAPLRTTEEVRVWHERHMRGPP